ncbi:MAG: carboxypeptidase-like regulatory domain-containing protein [Gemmatimonadetes bacterium]|nr:carboxypeptidase-like regulatory domain-containing protein [Gemmatimonadota bacterium]
MRRLVFARRSWLGLFVLVGSTAVSPGTAVAGSADGAWRAARDRGAMDVANARVEANAIAEGAIRGRVVESGGDVPVAGAQVLVVGTRLGALSAADGSYIIRGVTAGSVQVRALRLGYQPSVQTVVVTDGGEATANFTLTRSAIQLEAVVTTATGQQSRKSVGNVVASVQVDSLVGRQP